MSEANVEVTNPSHYGAGVAAKMETIDATRSIGFNVGNAYKYLDRVGQKGGGNTTHRDSGSAIWYLLDITAYYLSMDEYVPDVEFYAENRFQMHLADALEFGTLTRLEYGLTFSLSFKVAEVLARMHAVIKKFNDAIETGLSEQAHKELVEMVLSVSYNAIQLLKLYREDPKISPLTTANILDIYRGTKSMPLTEEVIARIINMFALMKKLGDGEIA